MAVTGKEANLRVLLSFRLKGEHIQAGSVIAKSEFGDDKGAWSELCTMTPQTCTQTDDALVRVPGPRDRAPKMPAAK